MASKRGSVSRHQRNADENIEKIPRRVQEKARKLTGIAKTGTDAEHQQDAHSPLVGMPDSCSGQQSTVIPQIWTYFTSWFTLGYIHPNQLKNLSFAILNLKCPSQPHELIGGLDYGVHNWLASGGRVWVEEAVTGGMAWRVYLPPRSPFALAFLLASFPPPCPFCHAVLPWNPQTVDWNL